MKSWLLQASKVSPPMKASNFCVLVKDHFHHSMKDTNESLWMKDLGFTFGNNACLSICHDGQQREIGMINR